MSIHELFPSDLYPRGKRKPRVLYFSYGPRDARKQVSTGLREGQETQAEEFRRRYLNRIEAERAVLTAAGQLTGNVTAVLFIESWCQKRLNNKSKWDRKNEVARLRNHVIPRLTLDENGKSLLLRDVRPRHVQQLVRELVTMMDRGDLAARTVRHIFFLTSQVFKSAVAKGLIAVNPCVLDPDEPLPAKRDKDPTRRAKAFYSKRDCELLLSDPDVPLHRRVMWAFLIFTGARFGEMAATQWLAWESDYEPLGKILLFRSYNYEFKVTKDTKTEAIKEVPVHPQLAGVLAEWKLHGWAEFMGRQSRPDDLMFPAPRHRERDPSLRVHNARVDVGEALSLRAEGKTYAEIAKRFGVKPPAVVNAIARHMDRRQPEPFERAHGDFRDHGAEMHWFKRACTRLGIKAKRQHDFRSTFLTLLAEADADNATVNVITHAPPLVDAPDLYRRHTWAKRCREVMKHPVVIRPPLQTNVVSLRAAPGAGVLDESSGERVATVLQRFEPAKFAGEKYGSARESNPPSAA